MIRRLLLCASALLPLPLLPLPALAATGPFASPSTLPFEAPDFTRLHDADYQPAIEQAIALQRAEIEAIAANPAPPSFANTIEAMERSGAMLTRATNVFSALVAANTNDTLDKADTATAPQLAALHDAIMMNAQLFARVNHLYEQRAHLGLAPDQLQLLEVTWRGFRLSGALLAPEAKLQLQAINQQLSTLQTSFSQKLVAATKDAAPTFADKAQLAGLAEGDLAAAAKAAEERKAPAGSYVLPLQNTLQQPALESLTNRATRQALYTASATRAEQGNANDTRATILEIARLRAQKAQLLGYPDYASLALADQMAQTPARAIAFMQALVPPLAAQAHAEAADLDALIAKEGGHFTVEPWDWPLYAAQLRKSRLAFDAASAKPYFEITRVLEQGVFYAAHQLYGLSFEKRGDIPTYHRDVSVYTVKNAQGQAIGLFYFDPWKRDNKQGGAWMSNFVQQSTLLGEQPVVFNVENFTPPAPGQPALVGFDDVVTMFHEFGHALHGLLSDQRYPSLAGTSTARDFVEFPSQFNENWATDPDVLAHYARHWQTGAAMPAAMAAKLKELRRVDQAYELGEVVAAALLDMAWHSQQAGSAPTDVAAFERQALAASGLDVAHVPPRYRSSLFRHIWSNDYAAGYYAYLWTEMLAHDAFAWFEAHGGLTRANGQRFADCVLSRGHSADYGAMFRAFAGHDPDVAPMLAARGLK